MDNKELEQKRQAGLSRAPIYGSRVACRDNTKEPNIRDIGNLNRRVTCVLNATTNTTDCLLDDFLTDNLVSPSSEPSSRLDKSARRVYLSPKSNNETMYENVLYNMSDKNPSLSSSLSTSESGTVQVKHAPTSATPRGPCSPKLQLLRVSEEETRPNKRVNFRLVLGRSLIPIDKKSRQLELPPQTTIQSIINRRLSSFGHSTSLPSGDCDDSSQTEGSKLPTAEVRHPVSSSSIFNESRADQSFFPSTAEGDTCETFSRPPPVRWHEDLSLLSRPSRTQIAAGDRSSNTLQSVTSTAAWKKYRSAATSRTIEDQKTLRRPLKIYSQLHEPHRTSTTSVALQHSYSRLNAQETLRNFHKSLTNIEPS